MLFVLLLLISGAEAVDVEDYLKRFGYIAPKDPFAAAADDPNELENGIKQLQDFYHLPITGVVDEALEDLMSTARCGNEDIEHSRSKRYATANNKWRKRHLHYAIAKYHNSLSLTHDNINDVVRNAFSLWQEHANINITMVQDSRKADLRVSFLTGSHSTARTRHINNRLSFDGPGGVLAHASFPTVGEIHFDDQETWLLEGLKNDGKMGYNLKWAAVHELGHALGLKHSRVKNSIMNPLYKTRDNLHLNTDDIKGIQRLYGKPGSTAPIKHHKRRLGRGNQVEGKCNFTNFDAVLTHGTKVYGFYGDKVWMFNPKSRYSPKHNISDIFPGITGPVEAAMSGVNNKIYFFRSGFYWRWDSESKSVDRGFPRRVAALGSIYTNINAAFTWALNGKGYMFSEAQYWRYDFIKQKMDPGYPRSIQTWRGLPHSFKSITSAPDGKTYILDTKSYWIYNDTEFRVQPVGYSITNKWRACGARAKKDFFDTNLSKLVDSDQDLDPELPSLPEAELDLMSEDELTDLISAQDHVAMLRVKDNGVDLDSLMPESSAGTNMLSLALVCGAVVRALS